MKNTVLFSFFACVFLLAHTASADDFGARFTQSSPMALEDAEPMDPFAGGIMPYDIEPAAGDEEEPVLEDQIENTVDALDGNLDYSSETPKESAQ